MAKVIDTNLIVCFLLNDNPEQAELVQSLFDSSEKLHLPDMVVAEIIWVLQSIYRSSKPVVIEKIQRLLNLEIFICNYNLLNHSLTLYKENNISYVDAYILAFSVGKRLEGIYSFDRGLDKIKQVKRFEPKFSPDN